ncbi:38553_t:CDS:1, partial [Gigaspora margarita]
DELVLRLLGDGLGPLALCTGIYLGALPSLLDNLSIKIPL